MVPLVLAHGIRDGRGRTRCPRVGRDDPVPVTLADVCLPRAIGEQAAELGCLIAVDGFDVQVQPVLGELRPVRNRPEVDLERATADRDRYVVATAPHDLPAQRPSPELREQLRVRRVDDRGNNPIFRLYLLTHRSRTQPAAQRDAFCRGQCAIRESCS